MLDAKGKSSVGMKTRLLAEGESGVRWNGSLNIMADDDDQDKCIERTEVIIGTKVKITKYQAEIWICFRIRVYYHTYEF